MESFLVVCIVILFFLLFSKTSKQDNQASNSLDANIKDAKKIIHFLLGKTNSEKVNILITLHQIHNYMYYIVKECDLYNFKKTANRHPDICDKMLMSLSPHSVGIKNSNDYLNISSKIWIFTYRAYIYSLINNTSSIKAEDERHILENILMNIWLELTNALEAGILEMKTEEMMLPSINISCLTKESFCEPANIMPSAEQLYLEPDFNKGKMVKNKRRINPVVETYVESIFQVHSVLDESYERYIHDRE